MTTFLSGVHDLPHQWGRVCRVPSGGVSNDGLSHFLPQYPFSTPLLPSPSVSPHCTVMFLLILHLIFMLQICSPSNSQFLLFASYILLLHSYHLSSYFVFPISFLLYTFPLPTFFFQFLCTFLSLRVLLLKRAF